MSKLSRREFILLTAAGTAATLISACAKRAGTPEDASTPEASTPAPVPTPTALPPTPTTAALGYQESPMLAEQVGAGKLPPCEERLPLERFVVEPTNMVGKYGGTFFTASMTPNKNSDFTEVIQTTIWRWPNDLSERYPNVGTAWEWSDDYRTLIIELRKGIRWSDGQPFTADDALFYFHDNQMDEDLYPVLSMLWQVDGKPMTVSKDDDFTLRFEFQAPYPAFVLMQESWAEEIMPWAPAHFMKQYHIKYNSKADEEAKAAEFNNWQARFKQMLGSSTRRPAETPTLDPWQRTKVDSEGQAFERSPYYFKVDVDDRQLPYVDRAEFKYTESTEVMLMKTVSGELSFAGTDLGLVHYPVLIDGEQQGNYKVQLVYSARASEGGFSFNLLHPDPVYRQLFNDVRWRQACSVAVNRDQINELVFLGQGTPRQATVLPNATFYKPEWGTHYAQYDPDLANSLLDELGLDKRGPDGVRLLSDGRPLAFTIQYRQVEGPKKEIFELVARHLNAVGMQVEATELESGFFAARLDANEHDASGHHIDRLVERSAYYSSKKVNAGSQSGTLYGQPWKDWLNSGGKSGLEPPEDQKELWAAKQAWEQTVEGTPEYIAAGQRFYDLVAEGLYVIGTVGLAPYPLIVKNGVENVFNEAISSGQEKYLWGAASTFWMALRPDQWFLTS